MALKDELKPGEKIILGECVITNDGQRTPLVIEGQTPILREKNILTPQLADTPAKRIYLAVQLMYTSHDARGASRRVLCRGARSRAGCTQHLVVHRKYQQQNING